jgi:hypothetical protein
MPAGWDVDLTATLVREAFEESHLRVGETAYLGYQEVNLLGERVLKPGCVVS